MTWKADIRVVEIDPAITDLMINLDGQTLRYAHGPVIPWNIVWPGPRGGSVAEMSANPRIRSDGSTIAMRGPWAVFRLFERGQISSTSSNSKTIVDFKFDGRPATVEINAGTQPNPLTSDVLKGFKCPGRRA
jgi:type VI secretion system protein ImpL